MARISCFRPLAPLLAISVFARAAGAGSPDPATLRDQIEDEVTDGDHDVEDLAVFHLPSAAGSGRSRAQTYVAISAFAGTRANARPAYGGFLVLQIPLERFARGRQSVPLGEARDRDGFATGAPPLVIPGLSEPVTERPERAGGPVVLTTEVARSCVRAAWRALGIADDAPIDSMASRARSSAALPELRLRAMRTIDESGRITLSDADPYRYTEAGTATNWLEARLTFRLDRLIFADEEVSLERVRIERSELRARTAAKVLQSLFEWQRAYALVDEPAASTAEHFAAVLRELEASAILDVMTDGWFGRFRASLPAKGR
jgi:hypothetical protein